MTADELAAMIAEEIDNNSGTRAILAKVQRGDATLADSERFTGITAEITGRLLADNVLSLPLSDRQGAFVDITAARYRDTFSVFSAVQRALDERLGINLAVIDPGFEKARAQKAGHALADQTVPESTVQRRAESAGENIVRSQHDRIVQKQAEFRDRAGLSCSAIREGGAKCCEWCASVSGKYPASDTPQGFWGRHDNCKCSILYETRKGVQRLGGSAKKWEPLRDAGAPEPTRLTAEQAAELEAQHSVIRFSDVEKMAAGKKELIDAAPISHTAGEKQELLLYARSLGIEYANPMQFDGDASLLKEQLDIMAELRNLFKLPERIVLYVSDLGEDCGETVGRRTIKINASAMRSDAATSAYLNADNQLSSTRAIGIGVHEIGHLITKKYGEIGLDIARQACYNVSGKEHSYTQTLDFLFDNVSEYSITKNPKATSSKFKPTHYHEVIPEILGKHFTNPDEFTTEFYRLLKEACQI